MVPEKIFFSWHKNDADFAATLTFDEVSHYSIDNRTNKMQNRLVPHCLIVKATNKFRTLNVILIFSIRK